MSFFFDSDQEIIIMMICALPCPPMPMLALRVSSSEQTENSSHDMVYMLMKHSLSLTRSNEQIEDLRQKRMSLNTSLFSAFRDMVDIDLPPPQWPKSVKHRVYQTFASYMRDLYQLYFHTSTPPDMRFTPAEDIPASHPLHEAAFEHLKAWKNICIYSQTSPDIQNIYKTEVSPTLAYEDIVCFYAYLMAKEEEHIRTTA